MTLDVQFITMLSMVIGGIYVGFANELFRRLSVIWRNNTLFIYIFEVLFWLMQTGILFYALYRVNHGEIRFYIFLAFLLGFSIYIVLFQTFFRRFLEVLIRIVKKVTQVVVRTVQILIIEPIKWTAMLIYKVLLFSFRLLVNASLIILKLLFYPFRLLWKLIEPILPQNILNFINKSINFCSTIVYKLKKRVEAFVFRRR